MCLHEDCVVVDMGSGAGMRLAAVLECTIAAFFCLQHG